MKACKTLLEHRVNILVVIGGDGSLTGAYSLYSEWNELLVELQSSRQITKEQIVEFEDFFVAGLAASIDNDLIGTDATIGAFSSLHRIVEAVQCIQTTASSHMRSFVIEVMGRNCGWLASMAAIATGADYVLIPEQPSLNDWREQLITVLGKKLKVHKQMAIVIIAEGATDATGSSIKPEEVRDLIETSLQMETRITSLGHMQRGGITCAYDRYLSTVQGAHITNRVLTCNLGTEVPFVVGISMNRIKELNLKDAIENTRKCSLMLERNQYEEAFSMRSEEFKSLFKSFLFSNCPSESFGQLDERPILLVMHNGAPCGGMNTAIRCLTQYGLAKGFRVLGVNGGFPGLATKDVIPLDWTTVDDWAGKGGCVLGTSRFLASDCSMEELVHSIKRFRVNALVIVGGFEAFLSCAELARKKTEFPALQIPIICIPATVSNNIPGTENTIGSDTALNVIVEACDKLKQSASSYRNRVFLVDVQGGNCGYLSTIGALGGGAAISYIQEEGISLGGLQRDVAYLRNTFREDNPQGRIVIRNENSSDAYPPNVIASVLQTEAEKSFDVRYCVLGHLQQGGFPSPFDRILAVKLCAHAIDLISSDEIKTQAGVVGVAGSQLLFTSIFALEKEADLEMRRPLNQWWMTLRPLIKQLSRYTF